MMGQSFLGIGTIMIYQVDCLLVAWREWWQHQRKVRQPVGKGAGFLREEKCPTPPGMEQREAGVAGPSPSLKNIEARALWGPCLTSKGR